MGIPKNERKRFYKLKEEKLVKKRLGLKENGYKICPYKGERCFSYIYPLTEENLHSINDLVEVVKQKKKENKKINGTLYPISDKYIFLSQTNLFSLEIRDEFVYFITNDYKYLYPTIVLNRDFGFGRSFRLYQYFCLKNLLLKNYNRIVNSKIYDINLYKIEIIKYITIYETMILVMASTLDSLAFILNILFEIGCGFKKGKIECNYINFNSSHYLRIKELFKQGLDSENLRFKNYAEKIKDFKWIEEFFCERNTIFHGKTLVPQFFDVDDKAVMYIEPCKITDVWEELPENDFKSKMDLITTGFEEFLDLLRELHEEIFNERKKIRNS